MKIAASVRVLTPYVPGEQPKSRSVIKLNTNENPYPPTPRIHDVLSQFNLDDLRRYPDPVFNTLRQRLADLWHTTPEHIFVGNGSDEVLTLAARAFVDDTEAIGSFDPSYSLYKTLAAIRNVPFVASPLADDFTWCEPVIKENNTPVALFLLTNPNAPTSVQYPTEKISDFAKKFPGVLLVDEAYADFADSNCVQLATDTNNSNIIVMRTFSKSYSLAGLRVGFCIGPVDLIEALYKVKDSYNVDALAQAVATIAVEDQEWMLKNVEQVRKTREYVRNTLLEWGWNVPPSQSNFLFARPAHVNAATLFEALREKQIFVRYFLGPKTGDRLRITIGTNEDMTQLLNALEVLDK